MLGLKSLWKSYRLGLGRSFAKLGTYSVEWERPCNRAILITTTSFFAVLSSKSERDEFHFEGRHSFVRKSFRERRRGEKRGMEKSKNVMGKVRKYARA